MIARVIRWLNCKETTQSYQQAEHRLPLPGASVRLNRRHCRQQLRIKSFAVSTSVDASVTIRAQGDNERWIVGATVTYAQNMVWLQIWTTVFSHERGRNIAALTMPACASQDVVSNVTAALIDVPDAYCFRRWDNSHCRPSELSKFLESRVCLGFRTFFRCLDDRAQRAQLEHDRVALTVRQKRSTKTLSRQAPLLSMLIEMPLPVSTLVNSALVNWLP